MKFLMSYLLIQWNKRAAVNYTGLNLFTCKLVIKKNHWKLRLELKSRLHCIHINADLSWPTLTYTGCPNKHGNSVTNWISSLLCISNVIPNFKIHNIIMSARIYFMKRVNGYKDVSLMSPQDEQWRRTSLLCLFTAIFLFY